MSSSWPSIAFPAYALPLPWPPIMTIAIIARIAAEVGVSTSTVIRALNSGHIHVRPTVAVRAERIRALARRYGYQPNSAAKALITGRFRTVELLTNEDLVFRSYLSNRLLYGVMGELIPRELKLLLSALPTRILTDEQALPRALREHMVDGTLVAYQIPLPAHVDAAIGRLPSVWINSQRPRDGVRPDDAGAAATVASHLLDLGHARIAYVDLFAASESPERRHYSRDERLAGFASAMAARGAPVRICSPALHFQREAPAWCRALLAAPERPTAIAAYGAGEAFEVMRAAADLGLRIPGDLSLVVVSGAGEARLAGMQTPDEEMGRQAVRMLVKRMAAPRRHVPSLVLPFTWQEGVSLGPPPR